MEKVNFTFKTGRKRLMSERDAKLLERLGKGAYMTRDLRAAPATAVLQTTAPVAPQANSGDILDTLDKDALHALAKERGVKVHHAAGADKVRAALRGAAE